MEKATLGGGCFWCLEAYFERLDGVNDVVSGYADGEAPNPTYEEVCSGASGHAEVVQITFDPTIISFEQILDVFWECHDPTTPNRQGADAGTQYRSTILYQDDVQKTKAQRSMDEAGSKFNDPIVTLIRQLPVFFPAEDYHQDYFRTNPDAPYCRAVITPKLAKLSK